METIETLRRMFDYNEWANVRAIESLKQSDNPSAKAVRALAHLVIAEKTWLARFIKTEDSTNADFWPASTLEECEALFDETRKAYSALLADLTEAGLDSTATYKNSKGVEYTTRYGDMLSHVLMHSAYHRGQVAMAVRAEGGTPAYTDYIGFVRERDQRR
ncbi:MAG TPA: DinB family protein [Blastocatellia bacterium]|nr:DinB family protein [Blastocatellia bacterium]